MEVAIQLYSLKDAVAKHGFDEVLRRVKEAGFDGVEFAGYHELGVEGAATALKKYGLKAMGAHTSLDGLYDPIFAKDAAILGLQSAAVSGIAQDKLVRDFDSVVKKLSVAVQRCADSGIPAYYHNHAHEFVDGKDYLQELCSAVSGLLLETDIFWIKAAGFSPTEYFRKYSDTIGTLHVKEMHPDGIHGFNPVVGQGITECKAVVKLAVRAGHKWCVLEAENIEGDPFLYIEQSANAIKDFIAGA